jgi:hypothetical protein
VWSDSGETCAFSDDERHLGHIISANGWQAFDATKLNDAGDSYRYLGRFRVKREAKAAVEESVFASEGGMVMTAH